VILLPDGEDPDSYIKKRGTEAFAGLLNQSTGLLEFAIGQGLSDSGAGSIEGKLKIVDRILPVIRKVSRPIERAYYVKQLAERLGLEERELTRELTQRGGSRSEAPGTMASRTPPKWPKEEQIVLHLLVHDRIAVDALLKEIEPSHFSDERLRRLFTLYLEAGKSGGAVIPTGLRIPPDRADSEIAPILTAFLVDEPNYDDAEQTLKDCIRTLRVKKIRVQMKTLENEIRNAEKTGDNPQVKSLLDKMVGLKKMSLEVGN